MGEGGLGIALNQYFFSVQGCGTKDGPVANKPCIFPFTKSNGVSYSKCTTEGHDQLWCSTEVDADGYHLEGQWGNCNSNCGKGKILSSAQYGQR